jgi:hypothetical protein
VAESLNDIIIDEPVAQRIAAGNCIDVAVEPLAQGA